MRPDDLLEYGCRTYARPSQVAGWPRQDLVERGLRRDETALVQALRQKTGRLLLGMGGGREAIPVAQMVFEVTRVDFVLEKDGEAPRRRPRAASRERYV